jgi:hypothetical protein
MNATAAADFELKFVQIGGYVRAYTIDGCHIE